MCIKMGCTPRWYPFLCWIRLWWWTHTQIPGVVPEKYSSRNQWPPMGLYAICYRTGNKNQFGPRIWIEDLREGYLDLLSERLPDKYCVQNLSWKVDISLETSWSFSVPYISLRVAPTLDSWRSHVCLSIIAWEFFHTTPGSRSSEPLEMEYPGIPEPAGIKLSGYPILLSESLRRRIRGVLMNV